MSEEWDDELLLYLYDTDGSPIGMQYRNTSYAEGVFDTYWFEKNLQGDIVAVYDEEGTKLVSYTYDAWGNCDDEYYNGSDETIVFYNPFRYRGYYLDTETGFYYLNSRYYDPAIGRFSTADKFSTIKATPLDLTDKNLYAYCDNNPVTRRDDGGAFWGTFFDVVSLVCSVVDVIQDPKDPLNWIGLAGDIIDLAPVVSGVGEISKAVSKGLQVIDDVHDVTKVADNVGDAAKATDKLIDAKKTSERASAVRKAWKNEFNNVSSGGHGISRQWSDDEIVELLSTGKVKGYQGHHMKSVKGYPELAGDPTNIQFLTPKEHLKAHGGNWRNITHGRFYG